MALCNACEQEMKEAESCTFTHIEVDGEWVPRNSTYFDGGERCFACGIVNREGNVHHPGCDWERCPKCGLQLITCDCKTGDVGIVEEGGSPGKTE